MKTVIHPAHERGHANHGWLNAYHSFSFANYYDPTKTHFGLLRVLNDDTIAPGAGFGMHPHENMEIVTIPLSGALEHKDSTGGHGVISRDEVQVMSAGTGIHHSEYNSLSDRETKVLQVWVFPKLRNIHPRYDQKIFLPADRKNRWQTIAGGDITKNEGALWINQDAYFSLTTIDAGRSLDYHIKHGMNGAYVFLIEGSVQLEEEKLERRDAAGITGVEVFTLKALSESEVLVIEVPMN